jgi:hypothetical protein
MEALGRVQREAWVVNSMGFELAASTLSGCTRGAFSRTYYYDRLLIADQVMKIRT